MLQAIPPTWYCRRGKSPKEENKIRISVVMFTLFTSVLLNTKLVPSLLNVPSPRALDVDTDYTDRT